MSTKPDLQRILMAVSRPEERNKTPNDETKIIGKLLKSRTKTAKNKNNQTFKNDMKYYC